MAYADIYAAAVDAGHPLRAQVVVAIYRAAVDIINESPETEDHESRLKWAKKVIRQNRDPRAEAEKWIWAVLENAVIQAAPAEAVDGDVQFVVNSLVSQMSEAR